VILAVTPITSFSVAYMKCGVYEIDKNYSANDAHKLYLVQEMF